VPEPTCELEVSIRDIEPRIWRKVRVPCATMIASSVAGQSSLRQ
jgi:hypothetical protein